MRSSNRQWAVRRRSWGPALRNVGDAERWMTFAAAAALAGWAIRRRQRESWALGAMSAALFYRAATGYCPAYHAAGISTSTSDTRRALAGSAGVHVLDEVIVNRPIGEVYGFWRNLENLPRVMQHLESVTDLGSGRSRWVARAPLGMHVEWDAQINHEEPNKVIGWRSVEGSTVVSAGSVNFDEVEGGTRVRVKLQYSPPGGKLGAWLAWAFGEEPSLQVRDDLERFKSFMEAGA